MAGGKRGEQAHPSNGCDRPNSRYDRVQGEETDYTDPGIQNMDVENQKLSLPPKGSTSEQEREPAASDQIFQWTCNKCRNVKIVPVISHVILILIILILIILILIICPFCYQERSVPSNHQKNAIKYPPVICPPDWIGHQGHCYKFSREEKNWEDSQNFCILHNASLAKITDEEMDFVTMLTRNQVFWIGLEKEPDLSWKWLDGTNTTLKVRGKGEDCAFLHDDATASAGRCSNEHRYICKKNVPKRS